MKKRMTIISVFLILSIVFSSCGVIRKEQDETKDKSDLEKEKQEAIRDELNIPLTRLNTLDPLNSGNFTYYNFSKLMYQSLFEFDKDLKPVPLLAEDYSIEDEGRTIEIELKDHIYWHNGDKLTSRDVDFTIEKLKDLNDESIYTNIFKSALGNFSKFNMKNIISTTVVDESVIRINFNKSYGNSLEVLTFPIVHKGSYSSDGKFEPVGTGPYKYKEYNSSQGATLLKNDDYWDGEVNISKINGKVFEDKDSILKAFEDGRVDFAYSKGVDLKKYEKDSNVKILEYISPEYEFMGYNFQNKLLSGKNGKKIRKAIYYGIDRQEIIKKVHQGHATQVDTPIHPSSYLTESVTNIYGYNAEKSKGILKEAGFGVLENDGILKDSLGKRLSFELVTNYSNPYRRQTAEIIKKNLEEIGIEIILKYPYKDMETLANEDVDKEWEGLNKIIKKGDYDVSLLGWEISEITDISFMFHSSFINSGSNVTYYKDTYMDSLLEDIYFTTSKEKTVKYINLQEKIMDDLPYASLFFKNKALLLRKNISGHFEPTFFNLYKGVEKYKLLENIE